MSDRAQDQADAERAREIKRAHQSETELRDNRTKGERTENPHHSTAVKQGK